MNRRIFLASLIAIPCRIVAAMKVLSRRPVDPLAYKANSMGIKYLLEDCGEFPPISEPDLDTIFNRVYAAGKPRRVTCCSPEYTKAIEKICRDHPGWADSYLKKFQQTSHSLSGEKIHAGIRALTG